MPTYSIVAPDGNTYEIEGPEGASKEDVAYAVLAKNPKAGIPRSAPKDATLGGSLKRGIASLLSSQQTGAEALMGDAAEAGRRGAEREKAAEAQYGKSRVGWDRVSEAYNKDGLLAGAKEVASQIPHALAEQAPNLAQMAATGRLGAAAGAPLGSMVGGPYGAAVGAVLGAGLGAFAPSALSQLGSNVQRQAETRPGAPIDMGKAGTAAVAQGALDVVGNAIPLGKTLIGKILGPRVEALIAKGDIKAAEALAKETLPKVLAKGTATGVLAETPTEVLQQVAERWQAGLSLTDADALKEYGQTAYQTALLGPVGAAGRVSERSAAQEQVAVRDEQQRVAAAEQARKDEEAFKQTPEYRTQVTQQYEDLLAKRNALIAERDKYKGTQDPAEQALRAQLNQQLSALGKELKPVAEAFAPFKADYDAQRKAEAEANEKLVTDTSQQPAFPADRLAAAHQQATQGLKDATDRINAAIASGDEKALAQANNDAAQHKQALDWLNSRMPKPAPTPRTPTYEEDQKRLAVLQNQQRSAIGTDAGAAINREMLAIRKRMAIHEHNQALTQNAGQRIEQQLGQVQEEENTAPAEEPTAAPTPAPEAPASLNDLLRAAAVEGKAGEWPAGLQPPTNRESSPTRVPRATPDTTRMAEQGLFGEDLEPGGSIATGNEPMLAKIEAIKLRPNLLPETKAKLDRFAELLQNPNLPENARAVIEDQLREIDLLGAGSGTPTVKSEAEMRNELAALRQKVQALQQDESIPQEQRDRATAGYIEQIRSLNKALFARAGTTEAVTTDRDRKQAVLVPTASETGLTPQATDAQLANQRMVEDQETGEMRPSKTGREVTYVNAEPQTENRLQFQQEGYDEEGNPITGTRTEEAPTARQRPEVGPQEQQTTQVNRLAPTGQTKVEAGAAENTRLLGGNTENRQALGDRELNEELAKASPKDQQTILLWDPVFGANSKAEQLVRGAEQGLAEAEGALQKAEAELSREVKKLEALRWKLESLAKAKTESPEYKSLYSQLVEQERVARDAQKAAENEAALLKQKIESTANPVLAAQNAANVAQERLRAAEAAAKKAGAAFWAEFNRLVKSGKLTPEFLQYVQQHDVKVQLDEAMNQLADVLMRSEAEGKAAEVADNLGRSSLALQGPNAQTTAKNLVDKARSLMGPRVAALVDNVTRLFNGYKTIERAYELGKLHQTALEWQQRKQQEATQTAADAKKALEARNETITAAGIKDELARIKLKDAQQRVAALEQQLDALVNGEDRAEAAKQKELDEINRTIKENGLTPSTAPALYDRLSALKEEIGNASTKPALLDQDEEGNKTYETPEQVQERLAKLSPKKRLQGQIAEQAQRVASKQAERDKLSDTAAERVKRAQLGVESAKRVRRILEENEAAVRAGTTPPLRAQVAEAVTNVNRITEAATSVLQGKLAVVKTDLQDVTSDLEAGVQHLQDLQRVEDTLTDAFFDAMDDYSVSADEIADILTASDLLSPELDEDGSRSENTIQRADLRARLRLLATERAQITSIRDQYQSRTQAALDRNTEALKNAEDATQVNALMEQRRTLIAEQGTQVQKYAEQLERLGEQMRAVVPELELDLQTLPATETGTLRLEVAVLKDKQQALLSAVQALQSRLDGVAAQRKSLTDALVGKYEADQARIKAMGGHTAFFQDLRKQLYALIAEGRMLENRAEQELETAKNDLADAQASGSLEEYEAAQNAFYRAVRQRDDAYTYSGRLYKSQLELLRKLNTEPKAPASALRPTAGVRPTGEVTVRNVSGVGQQADLDTEIGRFQQRISQVNDARSLRKELGGVQGEIDAALEALKKLRDKKVPLNNANARNSLVERTQRAERANKLSDQIDMLREKELLLTNRISDIKTDYSPVGTAEPTSLNPFQQAARQRKIDQIAEGQTEGRTTQVTKKERLAGDLVIGTKEGNERNAVGTRNPPTETPLRDTSTTSEQATGQALEDTAKGTTLRSDMEAAAAARKLAKAEEDRAKAKEKLDLLRQYGASKEALEAAFKEYTRAQQVYEEARKAQPGTSYTRTIDEERTEGLTKLDETASAAVRDGKVETLLKHLSENAKNPLHRDLAKRLLPLVTGTKIGVVRDLKLNGETVEGVYRHDTNTVDINPLYMSEETVLHELLHAATVQVINRPASQRTAEQNAAVRELEGMHKALQANPKFKDQLASKNLAEFVAEVYTNKPLRDAMDNVGKPASLLQRFWSAVKRMFGIEGNSPSGKAIDAINEIMDESQAKRMEAGPTTYTRTVSAVANTDDKKQPGVLSGLANMGRTLETLVADMRTPIWEALRTVGPSDATTQAYASMLQADQSISLVQSIMGNGAPVLTKDQKGLHIVTVGKGPSGMDVMRSIRGVPGKDEEKFRKATDYMLGLQAERLGYERFGSNADRIKALMAEVKNDAKLKEGLEAFRKVYNQYNESLVRMVQQTGAFSKDDADAYLKHGDYVPRYRQRNGQLEMAFGDMGYRRIGEIKNTPFLHSFKGGEELILPINETLLHNTMLLTSVATTNMAKRNLGYVLSAAGKDAKKMQIHRVKKGGASPTGPEYITWSEEPRDATDSGKRFIEVDTEGTALENIPGTTLVHSLEATPVAMPFIVNAVAKMNDYLRAGITRTPIYLARQLMRDPMSAASVTGMKSSPFTAVAKTLGEYATSFTGNETIGELNKYALIQNPLVHGAIDDINKLSLKFGTTGSVGGVRKVLNFLDQLAHNADAATRAQVWKDSKARGMSDVEAYIRTAESMNFHRRGAAGSVQMAARVIPFLNSSIQAINTAVRTLRGQAPFEQRIRAKQTFVNNMLMLGLAGFAYAAFMNDSDDGEKEKYGDLPLKDRFGNIHLRIPGTDYMMRLPIGYAESGGLAWALGQALFESNKGDADLKRIASALGAYTATGLPNNAGIPVPSGLKQAIEWGTNTDLRTFNPIVPARMEGNLPETQALPSTPSAYVALGKTLGLSPIKLQHTMDSLVGSLASDMLGVADRMFGEEKNGERPTDTPDTTPFLRSFMQRSGRVDATDAMYELANKAKQVQGAINNMRNEGRTQELQELLEKYRTEAAMAPLAGKFTQVMGELNRNKRIIEAHPKLSGDEKRDRIKVLTEAQEQVAQRYLQAARKIQERFAPA